MRIVLVFVLILFLSGCVSTPIKAYKYATSGDRRAKQGFIEDFNRADFERQKNGLEPLDFCTEQYYYDADWARGNPKCATRVVNYESGNVQALGTSVLRKE